MIDEGGPEMAKIIKIDAKDINSGHVMEKTEEAKVTSKTLITVPDGYKAVIFSNGHIVARSGACVRKKLSRIIGGDVEGRNISVLYVSTRKLTDMSWGIGNLPVKYTLDKNSITIQVGASGTFLAEIRDPVEFFTQFGKESGIVTLPEATVCITLGLRHYASEVILGMFSDAAEPILDTGFMLDETDLRLNAQICRKKLEKIPGIVFTKVLVSDISVREEDIEALREFYRSKKRKK